MNAPALVSIANGVAGFQAAVSANFFPYIVEGVGQASHFESAAAAATLGALRISRTHVNEPFYGVRRSTPKRRDCASNYVLMLVEDGEVCLTGARSAVACAGDLVLLDNESSLQTEQREPGTSLAVSIPVALLELRYSNIRDWCLRTVPSGEGAPAVLRNCMTSYWDAHNAFHPVEYSDIETSLVHLIGAAFKDRNELSGFESQVVRAHFLRIRDLVIRHLNDEQLNADFVADQLGISKSYMFVIMNAAKTTLRHFILEQRLEKSRTLLADPATSGRTITEIAFAAGFQDLSHFSRRFTEYCGKSPRAYRVAAMRALERN